MAECGGSDEERLVSEVRAETSHGTLIGERLPSGLVRFLGVPYARPPVGELRFCPPQELAGWRGDRLATSFPPSAIQPPPDPTNSVPGDPTEQSEDCLYLNIWTPGCDGEKRAVMVWIHGGGFVGGSPSSAIYAGDKLAAEGVVVVNVGYRLGALGWLAHPGLADELGQWGNWGLSDQLAALSFIRTNAATFGGDPDNITVFGESAGAIAVAALLGLSEGRPLFRRAIMQSGAAMALGPAAATAVAERFVAELGMKDLTRSQLLELPVSALLRAQDAVRAGREGAALAFQPVVDETSLREHPAALIAAGSAAGVDLLIGTNKDEWRFWMLTDPRLRDLDWAGAERLVAAQIERARLGQRLEAAKLVESYRLLRQDRGQACSPVDVYCAIATDWTFRVPSMRLAAGHDGGFRRVYAYLFDWESPLLGGMLGSCHALELPFVFGSCANPHIAVLSGGGEEAEELSAAMRAAWARFAATGDPSGGRLGDWPVYDAGRRLTKRLGRVVETMAAPMEDERAIIDVAFGPFGDFEAGLIRGASDKQPVVRTTKGT
jgi:para-nitrobenzyl esterase